MKNQQITRILKICIIATIIMLISDIIFSIPQVINFFSDWVTSSTGWILWLLIWVIMFLQCTILNIPAYVILSACVSVGIHTLSISYILVVISAYMAGCILAYWVGRWWGTKAVRWCAGSDEDFNKWCIVLNTKGRWYYALTVLFPFFPDDLLCIVCGSVKLNFWFFTIVNLIGRTIGLITMLLFLTFVGQLGGGFPIMPIVWIILLLGEIITYYHFKRKNNED